MKKYELIETDKTTPFDNPLFQVLALRDFGDVRKGDLGGYIESTYNLSHEGNCWIYDDARVYGDARVAENARVSDEARVSGNALVFGNAQVSGDALVYDNAWVYGNAQVYDNALVSDNARVSDEARVSRNARVYGNAEIYGTTELTGGYAFDTKDNGNDAQSAPEKPKTCHDGQTGKFCSECGEKL